MSNLTTAVRFAFNSPRFSTWWSCNWVCKLSSTSSKQPFSCFIQVFNPFGEEELEWPNTSAAMDSRAHLNPEFSKKEDHFFFLVFNKITGNAKSEVCPQQRQLEFILLINVQRKRKKCSSLQLEIQPWFWKGGVIFLFYHRLTKVARIDSDQGKQVRGLQA